MLANEVLLPRIDVNLLATYQQLYCFIIPIFTNIGFVNVLVVVVRLYWFRQHLKKIGKALVSCNNSYIRKPGD